MYVRMLWGRLKTGMWDEYEKYYNEHMNQLTEGMDGFRGRQLLRSTENPDEGLSITLWETLDAIHAYTRDPRYTEVSRGIQDLYVGEYWVRQFEIKSSTV